MFGHVFHQKAEANLVQLVRDEVVSEFARKTHQVIVGDGPSDNYIHSNGCLSRIRYNRTRWLEHVSGLQVQPAPL